MNNIRTILGMAALVLATMAVTVVPALAGLGGAAAAAVPAAREVVLIDSGVIATPDGQGAMSAYAVTLSNK